MAIGEGQAIQRNMPAGNGVPATDFNAFAACTPLSLSAGVSSTGNALPAGNGYFVTFIAIGTVEVHIRGGNANVAAATANDYPIPPNGREEFWVSNETKFSAFCTASATLYYYRSSP